MVTRVFTSVLTTEDEITSFESRFRRLSAMKDWRRGLIVLRCFFFNGKADGWAPLKSKTPRLDRDAAFYKNEGRSFLQKRGTQLSTKTRDAAFYKNEYIT